LYEALLDAKLANVKDDPSATVLFLIHGIQTDGAWQRLVQREFRDVPSINVIDLGYDCVTPAQLVGPFRGTPIRRIARELRDARKREPSARFMVIAHSFGSYIVSRILEEHSDIQFERIVLCGAIVRRDFPWQKFAGDMSRGTIVTDVGTKDFYPVLATIASLGYGSSGRRGFQTGRVIDRYFPYGHSDFFGRKGRHIRLFWKPFIQEGRIKHSLWDTRKPKTGILILMLSHPWIGRSFALGLLLLTVWSAQRLL